MSKVWSALAGVALLCGLVWACNQPSPVKSVKIDLPPDPDQSDGLSDHPAIGKQYREAVEANIIFPTDFVGEWSRDPATCGTEGDDMDTRIVIRAHAFHSYDETHIPAKIVPRGKGDIAVIYAPDIPDYHMMIAPERLTLSADGLVLNGKWRRCPKRSPIRP